VNQIGTVTERLIEATKMAMQAGWGFMNRHHRSLIRLICSLQVCWNSGLETNYGPKVKHILVRVKVVSEGEALQQIVNGPQCAHCLELYSPKRVLWYLFRLTIGYQIIISFSKIHFGSLNCNF